MFLPVRYVFTGNHFELFDLMCESAMIYALQKSRISMLYFLSMFYFCINRPTVDATYYSFLEEHMFLE